MDFIAPFWTNFDNRVNGLVYYHQFTSGSILEQATQDINEYFPEFTFTATWVLVATWYEVAYYPNTGTVSHLVLTEEIYDVCFTLNCKNKEILFLF